MSRFCHPYFRVKAWTLSSLRASCSLRSHHKCTPLSHGGESGDKGNGSGTYKNRVGKACLASGNQGSPPNRSGDSGVLASEKPQTVTDTSSLMGTTGKQEGEKTLCDLLFSQKLPPSSSFHLAAKKDPAAQAPHLTYKHTRPASPRGPSSWPQTALMLLLIHPRGGY